MTNEERTSKLLDAAKLVAAVVRDLDGTTSTCQCCGSSRYNHYGEFRARVELTGTGEKLVKWAGNIERGLNKEKVE